MAKPKKKSSIPPLHLLIAVVIILILLGLFRSCNIGKNLLETSSPSTPQQPPSDLTLNSLNKLFANQIDQDFYYLMALVQAESAGELHDPGLQIENLFGSSFSVDQAGAQIFNDQTNLNIGQGDYSFFLIQAATPPQNPDIMYQLGVGLRPQGFAVSDSDPSAIEPIARDPHSFAFFDVPNQQAPNPWHQTTVFDVANNFAPTDDFAFVYTDPQSNLYGVVVPQNLFGQTGEPAIATFQIFGRQTTPGEIPNVDDPTGLTSFTCTTDQIPPPLSPSIFADGFESGDISAWSNTLCP